jgi:hypothetical protein
MGNPVSWGYQPSVLTDPANAGAIPVTEGSAVCSLISLGADETRTLADPQRAGQRLSLAFLTDGGAIAITAASAINQAGNTIMTWSDIGEHIVLEGIEDAPSSYEWRVVCNDGVVLS